MRLKSRGFSGLCGSLSLAIGTMALAFLEIRSWFQSFILNVEGNAQYMHVSRLAMEERQLGG